MKPKTPELVKVSVLAKEAGLSSEAMRLRLQRLEASLRRKVLYKGDKPNCHWYADKSYLSRMANDGGKSMWEEVRSLRRDVTDLKAEVAEVRRILDEHGLYG